jgi:gentisate 1,2-dioxygenase
MGNFYDEWLGFWNAEQEERARARKSINEEELEWVRTKQDYRAAPVCSRENGFVTAGNVMLGEIPKGWNTGKHSHGEEAIHIVEGEGFSIIDGKRYDWDTGSCLFIPFGVVNQHFNPGDKPVRYLSVMALALERFAGLAKIVQYEEASETYMGKAERIEKAESDVHPEYGQIVMRLKDAPARSGSESKRRRAEMKDEFHLSSSKEMWALETPSHRARGIYFMAPDSEFKAREMQMTHIAIDDPGKNSGKHGHMEALLYVLQGEGYSIVDGEKVPWKKGTLIHVQGPQTVHQHFNTGQIESRHLRIHYGLRAHYFQFIARRVFPYVYYEYSAYK